MSDAKLFHVKVRVPIREVNEDCARLNIMAAVRTVSDGEPEVVSGSPCDINKDLLAVCKDIRSFLKSSGYDTRFMDAAITKAEGSAT